MARSSPNSRCSVGAPRRRSASSIDGRSSRINDDAWIISMAAAAGASFSARQPNASPTAIKRMPRTRLPGEARARRMGASRATGAPAFAATSASARSIKARRASKESLMSPAGDLMLASGRLGNSMKKRHFGRTQQIWVLVFACLMLFGAFVWFVPGMTFTMWWKVLMAAGLACAGSIVVFQMWVARALGRREGVIKLIDRVTGGDLSISARDIVTETQSMRTAAAMRGLVANLERTIRRFGQLA